MSIEKEELKKALVALMEKRKESPGELQAVMINGKLRYLMEVK